MQQSHTPTTPFGRRSLMLARVASGIAASTRPPEKLPRNKRFAGNGAGAETEVASSSILHLSSLAPKNLRSSRCRQATGTTPQIFSRPHTCSRRVAPTVAVAQTQRRITDQQPNLQPIGADERRLTRSITQLE
jgi:hypothetical protein